MIAMPRMERRRFLQAIGGATVVAATGPGITADRAAPFSVVGYLPWYRLKAWSPAQVGPLTDLVYFGVQPTTSGELPDAPIDRATLETLRGLKRSTRSRLHLCVGGGDRSAGFAPLVGDARLRRTFVRRLRDLCQRAEFDGVDYDWEYPAGTSQLADYRKLLEETRRSLGNRRVITVAQSPWRDFGRAIYEAVDRVHVMSYNHKHPHARLADSRADIERMLGFGCPREKLVLGVPFYGRNQRGRSRTYAEIVRSKQFESGSDIIDGFAFNSRKTLQQKTRYARESGLAGIMVWEIGQDSADPETSLLEAIESALD
jgi:GH18 family chitinase